ncbi:MAG: hypothetical protein GY777_24795 [Candidatus Brocadiaceae bacterium]|nr:hypothetical protein [Candidatus Brocadiaceae bacterium]
MKAKECVLQVLPNAKIERHKRNFGGSYYLVRNGNDYMWFSEGDTASKAWINARKRIDEERENAKTKME